jgi:hypothetical protein
MRLAGVSMARRVRNDDYSAAAYRLPQRQAGSGRVGLVCLAITFVWCGRSLRCDSPLIAIGFTKMTNPPSYNGGGEFSSRFLST